MERTQVNNLIFTIGMSGSGKTHLRKKLEKKFNDMKTVSPDDLRKKFLGDINSQEDGKRIFAIAAQQAKQCVRNTAVTYFDATGLNWSASKKAIKHYTENADVNVLIVFMMDSEDYELCRDRVVEDIGLNIERSNVPEDVMKTQHERFKQCLSNALGDSDLPDEWKIVLYRGDIESITGEIDG